VWVETRTIDPPEGITISGRFGGSIMFVAYSRVLDRWLWIQPGGVEEKIAEPEMIFVDEDYIKKHTLAKPRSRTEKPSHIHRKRSSQLQLDL
jgi:hypothetical protein